MRRNRRDSTAAGNKVISGKEIMISRRLVSGGFKQMANGGGIIELDLHGLRAEEAKKKIDAALKSASSSTYRIRLIHGFNRGTNIKNMIREEYGYEREPRVKRIVGGWNEGITELILREY